LHALLVINNCEDTHFEQETVDTTNQTPLQPNYQLFAKSQAEQEETPYNQ
jgi:hypothetical protein